MKKILAVILAVIASLYSAVSYQEVVTLKNGTVIRGEIVRQVPNRSLTVKTLDGNEMVFLHDEIESVEKIKVSKEQNSKFANKNSSFQSIKDEDRYMSFNIPYNIGVGNDAKNSYMTGIVMSGGQSIDDNFTLGFGSGYNYMGSTKNSSDYISFLPLFADVRFRIKDDKQTLFLFTNPGYGCVIGSSLKDDDYTKLDLSGGLYLNTGLGFRYKIDNRAEIEFSLGYTLQKANLEIESEGYYYRVYESYGYYNVYVEPFKKDITSRNSFFSITAGIYFK